MLRIVVGDGFDPKTEMGAIRIANDSPYGFAGAVFTNDAARAHRVIRTLRAGITCINAYHRT